MTTEPKVTRLIKRNLNLDENFARWMFLHCFDRHVDSVRCNADECVNDEGEVDIRVEFRAPDKTSGLVHLENKIDARPTEGQFERYRKRVVRDREAGEYDYVTACLVAPASYLEDYCGASEFFDVIIDYESLLTILESEEDKLLISAGIKKGKTAILPDPKKTSWKHDYFDIAREVWSAAQMASPSTQPRGVLMTYRLPKPLHLNLYESDIEHCVCDQPSGRGHNTMRIKLNFRDDSSRDRVSKVLCEHRSSDLRIDYGLSRSRRIYVYSQSSVPHVEITRPVREQAEAIRECARLAQRLHDWLRSLPGF